MSEGRTKIPILVLLYFLTLYSLDGNRDTEAHLEAGVARAQS